MGPTGAGRWWSGVPNLLSLSRLPLAVVLCICIDKQWWWMALASLALAAATDAIDGWWARRYGPHSRFGRSLDPLTDKVLTCSAFIYLAATAPATGITVWMATVIVARELLVTGLRGMVESVGAAFGADWGGKFKTISQFAVLVGVLVQQGLSRQGWTQTATLLQGPLALLAGLMVVATVASGVHYLVKAGRLLDHAGTR